MSGARVAAVHTRKARSGEHKALAAAHNVKRYAFVSNFDWAQAVVALAQWWSK